MRATSGPAQSGQAPGAWSADAHHGRSTIARWVRPKNPLGWRPLADTIGCPPDRPPDGRSLIAWPGGCLYHAYVDHRGPVRRPEKAFSARMRLNCRFAPHHRADDAASACRRFRENRSAGARRAIPSLAGQVDDQPGHGQHVLQFPAVRVAELPRQHVATPPVDRLGCLDQLRPVAPHARQHATSGS